MQRSLELVEPLPSRDEDCFAEFDRVFDSLATELEWKNAEPAVRVETVQRVEPFRAPAAQIALVAPKPVPAPTAPPEPEPAGDVLQEYERAFSDLDDKLAESNGVAMTSLAQRQATRRLQPRAAVTETQPARSAVTSEIKVKHSRGSQRTLEEVFGVLESFSIVRRRGRLSEERHLIARLLSDARQLCADLELQTARVRVEFAVLTLENNHFDRLGSEIDELARHIRHDLRFCSIAPGKKAASR